MSRALGASAPPPPVATVFFGSRLLLAEHYVSLLATTGLDHGLIGPAEGARLWERHVLNCAAAAPAFDRAARVLDIGSGAGLPGIVLAIARPDLQLTLVEPLQRRTTWLLRTVAELGLDNVEVYTGRAQSLHRQIQVRHATGRAVARLRVLAEWSLPLLETRGSLLAVKGATAEQELTQDREALQALGATATSVETYGQGQLAEPTRVVRVQIGAAPMARGEPHASRQRRTLRARRIGPRCPPHPPDVDSREGASTG